MPSNTNSVKNNTKEEEIIDNFSKKNIEKNENILNKTMPVFNILSTENKMETSGELKISNKETLDSSNSQCLICYQLPSNAVFMNCGHGGNFYFYFILKFFNYSIYKIFFLFFFFFFINLPIIYLF